MLRWRIQLVLFCTLWGATAAFAQDESRQSIIEQRIETIIQSLEEGQDLDLTNLLEDLTYYLEHPINLNQTTADQLNELHMLTEYQINQLMLHIKRYGALRSRFELQAVQGFDLATIKLIDPFITVVPASKLNGLSLKGLFKEGRHDLILRSRRILEKQGGFESSDGEPPAFAGGRQYLMSRYRFNYRNVLQAGFTLENDAGESLHQGPDFASGFVYYKDRGWVRKVIAGDFNAQFGQGLTCWSGLAFGKSVFIQNLKRNAWGLRPYSSLDENMYLRGAGTTLGWGKTELTLFYSSKWRDASLSDQTDTLLYDDGMVVSSLTQGGLHRTAGEINRRNNLHETTTGGHLRYASRTFSVGLTAVQTEFNLPIAESSTLYQQFRYSGKQLSNTGADYQWVAGNTQFFGETARSRNGAWASLNGLISALHPRLSVSLIQRYYEPAYQGIYVNSFGERNDGTNEQGLFAGVVFNVTQRWTLSTYADLVRHPWLQYRVDAPSTERDYLAQLNYRPDKKHEFYLRYRTRHSGLNTSATDAVLIDYPLNQHQQNVRLNGIYQAHPNLRFQSRAEWSYYRKGDGALNHGFLMLQDAQWKKLGVPLSITLRYALFSAPTWENRIYAYENDVLYAYNIPAYSGTGARFYTMLKWDVMRGVDLWLRYSSWIYSDRQTISSGVNRITGNTKSELTAQLRWQF